LGWIFCGFSVDFLSISVDFLSILRRFSVDAFTF
jgi:hypothetical protein